jgi:hypothetical protein
MNTLRRFSAGEHSIPDQDLLTGERVMSVKEGSDLVRVLNEDRAGVQRRYRAVASYDMEL